MYPPLWFQLSDLGLIIHYSFVAWVSLYFIYDGAEGSYNLEWHQVRRPNWEQCSEDVINDSVYDKPKAEGVIDGRVYTWRVPGS